MKTSIGFFGALSCSMFAVAVGYGLEIRGKVMDIADFEKPLSGAIVRAEWTSVTNPKGIRETQSNADGEYSVEVEDGAIVTLTFGGGIYSREKWSIPTIIESQPLSHNEYLIRMVATGAYWSALGVKAAKLPEKEIEDFWAQLSSSAITTENKAKIAFALKQNRPQIKTTIPSLEALAIEDPLEVEELKLALVRADSKDTIFTREQMRRLHLNSSESTVVEIVGELAAKKSPDQREIYLNNFRKEWGDQIGSAAVTASNQRLFTDAYTNRAQLLDSLRAQFSF